ncbi:hypothetical protein SMICM17S_00059 [Streptomyces microflavus]
MTQGFGFTEEAVYEGENGSVLHAELSCGNGRVMLGSKGGEGVFARAMAGAGPAGVYVVVERVDEHCARAREFGVEILMEPTDQDYGSRDYMARDAEGNVWSFGLTPRGPQAERRTRGAGVRLRRCGPGRGPADRLGQGRVGVRGGQRDQDLHGARVADGSDLVEQGRDGALDGGVEVADQQPGLAVPAARRRPRARWPPHG